MPNVLICSEIDQSGDLFWDISEQRGFDVYLRNYCEKKIWKIFFDLSQGSAFAWPLLAFFSLGIFLIS